MAQPQAELLADRLNSEPLIFRGCSHTELGMILLGAVLFWVPTALFIAAAFGRVAMGLGIAGVTILASVFLGATLFQKVKSGRPDNYYQHQLMIKLAALWGTRLILHQGHWTLGRNFHRERY